MSRKKLVLFLVMVGASVALLAQAGNIDDVFNRFERNRLATRDSIFNNLRQAETAVDSISLLVGIGQLAIEREDSAVAVSSFREALRINEDLLREKGQAYLGLSKVENQFGRADQAVIYVDSAVYFFQLAGDKRGLAIAMADVAPTLASQGNCEKAYQQFVKIDSMLAGETLETEADLTVLASHCEAQNICQVYKLVAPKAIRAAQRAIDAGYLRKATFFYSFAANAYTEMDSFDLALTYYDKMEAMAIELSNPYLLSECLNNTALVYLQLEQYDRAYDYLIRDYAFEKKYGDTRGVAISNANLGLAAAGKGDFKESARHLEESVAFFEANHEDHLLSDLYLWLAEAYAGNNDFQKAYATQISSFTLFDSLARVQLEQDLNELTVKYESEKKDRLIEQSDQLIQAEQQKSKLYLSVALATILAAVLLLLYLRARRQRKQLKYDKRQAELRYNLLRAQMNPHFIFNSLNSIQSFFSNQRFGQGNEFLGTFSQLVRRVLEQTGQQAISLSEELETLTMYLELEQLRLGNRLDFNIYLDPEVEADLIRVPPLIFQPFVENAIWHGIAPKNAPGKIDVHIDYNETEDALLCRIEDDGIGMTHKADRDSNHRSRGVDITRERLGDGGRIDIFDQKNTGKTGVRTDLVIPLWD